MRERHNLVLLNPTILAMRAHDVTNISACWGEEIDTSLRQKVSVGRIECPGTGWVRKSAAVLQIAI